MGVEENTILAPRRRPDYADPAAIFTREHKHKLAAQKQKELQRFAHQQLHVREDLMNKFHQSQCIIESMDKAEWRRGKIKDARENIRVRQRDKMLLHKYEVKQRKIKADAEEKKKQEAQIDAQRQTSLKEKKKRARERAKKKKEKLKREENTRRRIMQAVIAAEKFAAETRKKRAARNA